MLGTIRSGVGSLTKSAIALAAAILCSSWTLGICPSSSPRKMPGKPSALLIWLGKSERPVAMIAAPASAASSGMISGVGLAIAKTSELSFIEATSAIVTSPGPASPRNRSAPTITSDVCGMLPSAWLWCPDQPAASRFQGFRSSRSIVSSPLESISEMSSQPIKRRIEEQAIPLAPAPSTTTRRSLKSRLVSLIALITPASATTAVPC